MGGGGTWGGGSDNTPATGSSVMGFTAMPPMQEEDPDALDAFLDQLRGVWHHQPTLSGEMPTMGGIERAFMQASVETRRATSLRRIHFEPGHREERLLESRGELTK